jgi:predicted amidohydrolase
MPRTLTVSAVQFELRAPGSFEGFAEHVDGLLDRASGSDVVVFSELFTEGLFTIPSDWRDSTTAELSRLADYTLQFRDYFQEQARARRQCLVAGTTLEYVDDQVVNVCYTFFPNGSEHRHVKSHIFPAEADWRTLEGHSLTTFEVAGVTAGIAVCYEAEIPEISTILSRMGAEIIFCPSYTFTQAGFWRVRHCAAARCIENQIYMVHASTTGDLGAPLSPGWARSSILSPCDLAFPANGVVVEAETNREQVVTATLDFDLLHENRASGAATTFNDRKRRADMYRAYAHLLIEPS